MRRDPSEYVYVIIETVRDSERNRVVARPIEGQPFPTTMNVECPKEIRTEYPVGTHFRVKAVVKQPKGALDQPHLYSSYKFNYDVISKK